MPVVKALSRTVPDRPHALVVGAQPRHRPADHHAELRLVHAPRGASGWLAFPLRALGSVASRPMLAGAVQPA